MDIQFVRQVELSRLLKPVAMQPTKLRAITVIISVTF